MGSVEQPKQLVFQYKLNRYYQIFDGPIEKDKHIGAVWYENGIWYSTSPGCHFCPELVFKNADSALLSFKEGRDNRVKVLIDARATLDSYQYTPSKGVFHIEDHGNVMREGFNQWVEYTTACGLRTGRNGAGFFPYTAVLSQVDCAVCKKLKGLEA
jgi:hypothetical protein